MTRNDAQYIIEFNYQLARSDPKFENSINRDRPRSVSFRRCSLLLEAHAAWHMEEVLQCSCWPPRRACRVFRHSQARESATSQPAQVRPANSVETTEFEFFHRMYFRYFVFFRYSRSVYLLFSSTRVLLGRVTFYYLISLWKSR